jgi:hypothetical protein
MKTLITLIVVTTSMLTTGCVADGHYSAGYGYTPRASYGYAINTMPYRPAQHQRQVTYVGPQYYKTYDPGYSCNRRYLNYSSAPIIVDRGARGRVIVPRTW